jgi:hypothetical protein
MTTIGVAPYNVIAIVNKSTVMTNSDAILIVAGLNTLLPTFCKDWSIPLVTAVYSAGSVKSNTPLQCIIMDTSDVENALGYHGETKDVPYGKVFVKTILQSGGVMLYSPVAGIPTVASIISHEVFEMIVDPYVNVWWTGADGMTLYAGEVSDPVQSNVVKAIVNGVPIGYSDWILPAWANPQSKVGPYNHNNTLTAPMTLDKGGYLIQMKNREYSNIYGSDMSEYMKANLSNRTVKRSLAPARKS